MDEHYVGYLMNALDSTTHQQVEKHLEANPESRQRLESLKRALEPLAADQDTIDPPPLLALRSLARVAEHRCRPITSAPEIEPAAEGALSGPPWWRRADVLVAASLFIAILGIGIPGLSYFRTIRDRDECANNLRQFHQVLTTYADGHNGDFPGFDLEPPYNVAGMYVPVLNDAGLDVSKLSSRCPAVGSKSYERHSVAGLQLLAPEVYEKVSQRLSGCYAYSLGYRDPVSGQVVGLRRSQPGEVDNDALPIMADRPSPDGGNSPNHKGQNVLHVGGHVRFYTSTNIDGDDIYRNKQGKVAAGVDRFDTVLGSSGDRP